MVIINFIKWFSLKSHVYLEQYWNISTTVVGQGLPVPLLVGLAFSDLLIPHSRIVSPTYGGTVHAGLEPMTGMLLNRTSWRLYYKTGLIATNSVVYDLIVIIFKLYFYSYWVCET